jgi:DNA-binding transcriptional ArsR family regulator
LEQAVDDAKLRRDLADARREFEVLQAYIAGLEAVLSLRNGSGPSKPSQVKRTMAKGEAYAAVEQAMRGGGDHRPSTIAREIGTSPNSVSHVLRKMRERGLVEEAGFGVYRWKQAKAS